MTELNLNIVYVTDACISPLIKRINFSLLPQPYLAFIWSIYFFKKLSDVSYISIRSSDHREPTLLFVKWKFKSSERWKLNLFCSWICCGGAKRNGSCSTMQKRCLCRRYIRKFHNALFYVVSLAFHCWVITPLLLSPLVSLLVNNLWIFSLIYEFINNLLVNYSTVNK